MRAQSDQFLSQATTTFELPTVVLLKSFPNMDSGAYFNMPRSQAGFTMSTENDPFSSEREFKEPERRKLIIDILKRLGPTNSHFVSPALLAFLWLSDLCCLKNILQSVEDAVLGTSMVLNAAIKDSDILATCGSPILPYFGMNRII